jgi:hypothetical protein
MACRGYNKLSKMGGLGGHSGIQLVIQLVVSLENYTPG